MRDWNASQPNEKRGLAITPVKFGISFTTTHLNQAGALVLLYQDGTVQVNHGGTEMGQGVYTQHRADRGARTGPDARSRPRDGDAHRQGAEHFRHRGLLRDGLEWRGGEKRLRDFARTAAPVRGGDARAKRAVTTVPADKIVFNDNMVLNVDDPASGFPFAELLQRAYFARTSLSATGFYRTPEIHYDRETGRGKPFHYFAVGAAVSEVEVDGFTGMMHIRRVDILHDVGDSVNLGITRGQVEGGFVQGAGWLTMEELVWDSEGRLRTHSPDTYKIPAIGDTPDIFNVAFLTERNPAERHSRQQSRRRTAVHAGHFRAGSDSRCGRGVRRNRRPGSPRLARDLRGDLQRNQRPHERVDSRRKRRPSMRLRSRFCVRKIQHKLSVARGEKAG